MRLYHGKERNKMKAGDLITTYWKGYYIFVEFKDRGKGNSPIARFRKFADFNGKICKSEKILECDASYCNIASDHIKAEIEKKKKEINNLGALYELHYS